MRNCPNFATDSAERKLSLGGLGVAGEAGEVADIIKKVLHHEVPLETVRSKLIKEMGDVHWYLEYLAATLGVSTETVLDENVRKLRARHPNGWSPTSQQAKTDEAIDVDELHKVLTTYRNAVDALYNHNAATREAVILHFGIHHVFAGGEVRP